MSRRVILIRANYDLNRQAQPLGLAYLAAVLRQKGWQVRIVDTAPLNYSDQQILREIKQWSPLAVGLTATTPEFPLVAELAKKIKRRFSRPIIIGGPHVSAVPKQTLSLPCFDFAVLGEGEKTLPLLLEALDKPKKNLAKIKGIGFKRGKKLTFTPPQRFIKNLDDLPFPAHYLLPSPQTYSPIPSAYRKFPVAGIITSRGCPFQCIFCDRSVFGPKTRFRQPEKVVEEMETLAKEQGVRELWIWDDTFNLKPERVIKICQLMAKKKLNLSWTCRARVNLVNRRLLFWMKKAGCWQISYGIESGSEKMLKVIRKDLSKQMVQQAVELTKEAGIETKGFFMLGLPQETNEDIWQTIQFARQLPLDYAVFSIAIPYIGTQLYQLLPARRKRLLADFAKLTPYQSPRVYFTNQRLSQEEILALQKTAYRQFYFRPSYWWRQLRSIHSLPELILKLKSLAVLAPNI